jgi:hypothetical protein
MVRSRIALLGLGLHGYTTAGGKVKPNLLLLTMWNVVGPYFLPSNQESRPQGTLMRSAGKERRRKQKPLCNGDG